MSRFQVILEMGFVENVYYPCQLDFHAILAHQLGGLQKSTNKVKKELKLILNKTIMCGTCQKILSIKARRATIGYKRYCRACF